MSRRLLTAGGVAVAVVVVVSMATPAVAKPVAPPPGIHRVSGTSPIARCNPVNDATLTRGYEHQSSLAADPAHPLHLAATWVQDFEDAAVVSVSDDGGVSWAAKGVPGQMPVCEGDVVYDTVNNPRASVGVDGTVYVISNVSSTRTGDQSVRVNALRDGGQSWAGSTELESGASLDWVWAAADPTIAGRAYVLWGHRDRDENGEVIGAYERLAMTIDGGHSWTSMRAHPEPPAGSTYQFGELFLLADGSLLDVFEQCGLDQCASSAGDVLVSRTTDVGGHWSSPVRAATASTGWFAAAVSPDGTLNVVAPGRGADGSWRLVLSTSDDLGGSWRGPSVILDGDRNEPTSLTLAVAGDGTVGALYYDKRNAALASGLSAAAPQCQYDDGYACSTDAWLLTGRSKTWVETHLAGTFEATAFEGGDCCHGLGEWEGLVGRSKGFAALLTLGSSDTSDPDQQVTNGPTDVFLGRT
ncbi:MAG: hypothetical protein QOE35_3365 [Actinomycetota bacterium]|jgi:hypothetical protein